MRNNSKYDFKSLGQAIKEARENRGWTQERLAQEVDLVPRYIMSIENKGQHPSFQVFYTLVTLFDISVDQFFFPKRESEKNTQRRQLDALLDTGQQGSTDHNRYRKGHSGGRCRGYTLIVSYYCRQDTVSILFRSLYDLRLQLWDKSLPLKKL